MCYFDSLRLEIPIFCLDRIFAAEHWYVLKCSVITKLLHRPWQLIATIIETDFEN